MTLMLGGQLETSVRSAVIDVPGLGEAITRGAVDAGPATVPTAALRVGLSPRHAGLREAHVDALAEAGGQWPPLLVHRATMMVVDGAHRLEASKRLGLDDVRVRFLDCSVDQARVEAIRANTKHGMPLTMAERKASAQQLLRAHPEWSDRKVAEICGLAARTVASVRAVVRLEGAVLNGTDGFGERRIGRDGRARPVAPSVSRERIRAALRDDPDASLRTIAARVGVSPETVRAVRREQMGRAEPASNVVRGQCAATPRNQPVLRLGTDPAFTSTASGAELTEWFDASSISETDVARAIEGVPLSRVYEVIDEALRRATAWQLLAQGLRDRVR